MIPWPDIDTVLLDMDGTLLDLHFDNHFWLEHVPTRYAELRGIPLKAARDELSLRYQAVQGTMDWYCLDYWSEQLALDVAALKQEVDHLIAVHPQVQAFLGLVRNSGRKLVLVTNAHAKSLDLKMDRTKLAHLFDTIICSHDLGLPKENPDFWPLLQEKERFDAPSTLLIDDSLPVLRSAKAYGIAHLYAVCRPDSKAPAVEPTEFPAISDFGALVDQLDTPTV